MHWDHFFSDLKSRVLVSQWPQWVVPVSQWDVLGLEYVIRAEPLLAEDGSRAWVLGSLASLRLQALGVQWEPGRAGWAVQS